LVNSSRIGITINSGYIGSISFKTFCRYITHLIVLNRAGMRKTRPTCATLKPVLEIRENVPLAPLTTFQIGGPARFFAEAHTEADIPAALAYANTHSLPLFLLGGGSNLLVPDQGYPGLVLQIKIPGITPLGTGLFAVGAGEPWDTFVQHAIDHRFAGIECLAGIPGSVGGTPVQNVGAYGQEVAETITAVHAYDRTTHAFVEFDNPACNFRYRASRFNTDEPSRYIVHRVDFQLHPNAAPTLHYADLKRHFAQHPSPTLAEVATAVRDIRRSKGMLIVPGDPDTRSAGSYFKNPIISTVQLPAIAAAAAVPADKIPNWPTTPGLTKLPAAWLLEHSGFIKGYGTGPAGISTRHTLALVNRNHATFADIAALESQIVATVHQKFAITLEREPVLLA
jgi:UDP-N-acetylmuramate dehydrogenase